MTAGQDRYVLVITPTARRQLTGHLPAAVATAAYEFIVGPLPDNPYPVGKQLRPPLDDRDSARRGTYRVIYRIDDQSRTVTVVDVTHRRGAHRTWHGGTHPTRQPEVGQSPAPRRGVSRSSHRAEPVARRPSDAGGSPGRPLPCMRSAQG